jgi:hypothetical protein
MSSIVGRRLRPFAAAVLVLVTLALSVRALEARALDRPQRQPAQPGHVVHTKGVKSRGAATDPNIKRDSLPANHAGTTVPAPPSKGGAKTRGAMSGTLHVDNRTSWIIRIYVDGDYRGTLAPYGDWFANGSCESFVMYAEARFNDGSTTSWGPVTTNASCGDQKWTLRK